MTLEYSRGYLATDLERPLYQSQLQPVIDSQKDASRQLSQQTHLGESSGDDVNFFQNISSAFCDNPFCLTETWHAGEEAAALTW